MDWLLAALACFNIFSMVVAYNARDKVRDTPAWSQTAYSLIATEMAWLWLPVQITLAATFYFLGAQESILGKVSLAGLALSWILLVFSAIASLSTPVLTEKALKSGLGANYLQAIAKDLMAKIELKNNMHHWWRPFYMKRAGVEIMKNIPYGPLGIKHRLDIYRPTEIPEGGCPVLLQIHGGAWMVGSKELQAKPLMNHLASKGWICVAINYRLSPSISFPTQLEDCKRALCWIRTEGHKYGMNPDFVAVTGGSAGGHLASLMALTENRKDLQRDFPNVDTSVQAAVCYYGLYDLLCRHNPNHQRLMIRFIKNRVIFSHPDDNPELWELASPISQVHPDIPPMMVIQGTIDSLTTIGGAEAFFDKVRQTSKQPAVFLKLPGAEHGFDNIHSPRTDAVSRGVHRFLEWVRTQHHAEKTEGEITADKLMLSADSAAD